MENRLSAGIRAARPALGGMLLALTAVYVLFAALPFYGNGINAFSYGEIAGSHVDFKDYPPFAWPGMRIPATLLALIGVALAPAASLVLAPLLALSLALRWRADTGGRRLLWIGTLAANVAVLALTWQSVGLIGTWLAD